MAMYNEAKESLEEILDMFDKEYYITDELNGHYGIVKGALELGKLYQDLFYKANREILLNLTHEQSNEDTYLNLIGILDDKKVIEKIEELEEQVDA